MRFKNGRLINRSLIEWLRLESLNLKTRSRPIKFCRVCKLVRFAFIRVHSRLNARPTV